MSGEFQITRSVVQSFANNAHKGAAAFITNPEAQITTSVEASLRSFVSQARAHLKESERQVALDPENVKPLTASQILDYMSNRIDTQAARAAEVVVQALATSTSQRDTQTIEELEAAGDKSRPEARRAVREVASLLNHLVFGGVGHGGSFITPMVLQARGDVSQALIIRHMIESSSFWTAVAASIPAVQAQVFGLSPCLPENSAAEADAGKVAA
jgi:alkyl sulfatase BDS1-like metallo-beta-lactamase superfamily hydrolase